MKTNAVYKENSPQEAKFRPYFSRVPTNCNLYAYGANNPVHYIDPDGREVIFTIERKQESRQSYNNPAMRGKDSITFSNTETGDSFVLTGAQTVVSYFSNGEPDPTYPEGNTLHAFDSDLTIQYLGNNSEIGQSLYNDNQSSFCGPIFNVQNTYTESLEDINQNGVSKQSNDKTPFRVHSNMKFSNNGKTKQVPMASGGCPMYRHNQIADFANFLEENGVKPGDILKGVIKEDYAQ